MAKDKFAEVKTPLGDKLKLRNLAGREELGRPFTYSLELLSEDDSLKASSVLGQGVTVKLSLEDNTERVLHGIMTSFSSTGRVGRYTTYGAQLRPWIWLLEYSSDCRIFQRETIPDILMTVFRDMGFSDVERRLTGTYKALDYVVQYRETALNFVTRLMERVGIYYYFKHEEGKHTLVLADSSAAHEPAKGCETVPYYPPENSHARDHDHFYEWHLENQFRSGAYAINEFDFKHPNADLNAKSRSPLEHAKSDFELYDYPGEYEDPDDGETFAKIRLQAEQAQAEHIRAVGNVRGVNAGVLFTLQNFKRSDQNRRYLVVSIDSHLEVKAYESGAGAHGSSYECKVIAVDGKTDYRVPMTTPKPVVMGPQTAMVTGKQGEEIWTDEHGRVKLKFHWDREGKPNENSSCWVRVAQQWAGSGFGSIFIPRIGQEVVVDFLEGDPDRPLVTGRVYNAYQKPPHDLPGNASQSGIKTRSTKDANPDTGNEIRFEDRKDEEELFVHAQKDYKEVVEHDQTVQIHRDQSTTIDGSQRVVIKGQHALGDQPGAQLEIKGRYTVATSGKIDVASDASVTIHCGPASTIEMDPKTIKLSVGASVILIDATGIALTGPQLKLNP